MTDHTTSIRQKLEAIYHCLFDHYGPQHWWPADEPFEMIVGAILTQSTSWTNVEKAIANLKTLDALHPVAIQNLPANELAELIRPSGYYNAKAIKLKAFSNHLSMTHNNSLDELLRMEPVALRSELLSIHGIGPETADSIILYAARKPIFVIDAYTHRIMDRVGLNPNQNSYSTLQTIFMENLPPEESLFNEYHALLVCLGKNVCLKQRPRCSDCCIQGLCQFRIAL